jgi:hypothetical protein
LDASLEKGLPGAHDDLLVYTAGGYLTEAIQAAATALREAGAPAEVTALRAQLGRLENLTVDVDGWFEALGIRHGRRLRPKGSWHERRRQEA